ncbi:MULTISPECIES: 2-isopropylmalate synthase [Thalassobaculum]|mgnify:CR=1 FL=1|uniref:2-isopropylmalate synthase n=1 Tax=Thalassobaculum litoreum DSM 18839 TaxID=1123362 RepID=A0A8G2F384_9PROT|nr:MULTISPECIES: 2-isopropylmalate synthase [Thalassobaculum]SDF78729.1 2-isopropylmalate synthase [Thalassobaculum litoreum DSM 18839]
MLNRMPIHKYRAYAQVDLPKRSWPDKVIDTAPIWCSVDLRDGNQALVDPMDGARKRRMWDALVKMGFKQVEVGFPSASDTDFNFVRQLIEENLIPDDVTIQVLTQAREHLVQRTFESVLGAKNVIIHLYNSTSELQRRVVFQQDQAGVKKIATEGAEMVRDRLPMLAGQNVQLQYSPESFTGTELDYALEVCEAVMDIWAPVVDNQIILNLPSTVEMSTPNIYADQIEWMHRNFTRRDRICLSVHPHNDRGTGVAAAELAVMAGADRVEGTLFGNGERTGNVDIVTLGLNLFTQGVDPKLDFSDINGLMETAEYCNQLPIHPRHPYAGELVHTAFSGSHQDAINKGMKAIKAANSGVWEVPYLPIDPHDIGRDYEAVIRVNSQSGKGGIAYVLENDHHIRLPKEWQAQFSQVIQRLTDASSQEISSQEIWNAFEKEYVTQPEGRFNLVNFESRRVPGSNQVVEVNAVLTDNGTEKTITGQGNGPVNAFSHMMRKEFGLKFKLKDYVEHTRSVGSDAEAAAYIEIKVPDETGTSIFGVGIDTDITLAPIKAVVSACNRL